MLPVILNDAGRLTAVDALGSTLGYNIDRTRNDYMVITR
jgi:hypothetical protein